MSLNYAFSFQDRTITPDGSQIIDAQAHNAALERADLAQWAMVPDRHMAYYDDANGTVSTWTGVVIGRIVSKRIYRHNFGRRFIAVRVKGSNGASYHGRASYDHGNVIMLRKVK